MHSIEVHHSQTAIVWHYDIRLHGSPPSLLVICMRFNVRISVRGYWCVPFQCWSALQTFISLHFVLMLTKSQGAGIFRPYSLLLLPLVNCRSMNGIRWLWKPSFSSLVAYRVKPCHLVISDDLAFSLSGCGRRIGAYLEVDEIGIVIQWCYNHSSRLSSRSESNCAIKCTQHMIAKLSSDRLWSYS